MKDNTFLIFFISSYKKSLFIYFTIAYMTNCRLDRLQDAREKRVINTHKVLALMEFVF